MHDGMPGGKRGIIFLVAICAVFMQAGLWTARRRTEEVFPDDSFVKTPKLLSLVTGDSRDTVTEHPIPKLMAEAEQKFRDVLTRQSKTLVHAVAEYKRRFGRDPPRGFDDWWKFVQDNGVLMVDEYNAISEDLEPFWDLSPVEFRLRASLVRNELYLLNHSVADVPFVGRPSTFGRHGQGSQRRKHGSEHQRWLRQHRECQRESEGLSLDD